MTDDSQINISVCDKDVVQLRTGLTDSLLTNDFPVNFGSTLWAGSDSKERGTKQEVGSLLTAPSDGLNTGSTRSSNFNALVGPGDLQRKLLTIRRKLMLDMKRFLSFSEPKNVSESDLGALQFAYIREAYDNFREGLNSISDTETLKQLSENISDQFEKCQKVYHGRVSTNASSDEDELAPSDSISQVTTRLSGASKTSSVLKRIELDRKRAELQNLKDLAEAKMRKARLVAEAETKKARLLAEAEAEAKNAKFIAEAEAEEAEMLARLRLESANIEAEEKILASHSLVGSKIGSVSSAQSRARSRRSLIKETSNESKKVLPVSKISDDANALNHNLFVKKEEIVKPKKTFSSSKFRNFEAVRLNFDKTNVETKPKIPVINRDCEFALTSTTRAIYLFAVFAMKMCALLKCPLALTVVKSSLIQYVILVGLSAVKPYCILI